MEKENNLKSEFLEVVNKSIADSTFVKFTLGKYRGAEDGLENLYITPVKIKDAVKMSFRYKYKTRDVFKNYEPSEITSVIDSELGKHFLHGGLFTTHNDIILEYNKRRIPRTYSRKPTFSRVEIKEHNRIKTRYIDSREKYLNLLGITNARGEVKGDKYDKFRQIDKFIEIVSGLADDSGLSEKNDISIIDFGSGKSYLTFAMYDYFNNRLGINTRITGIEQRADLAELSAKTAVDAGFDNLKFENKTIAEVKQAKADIIIALHACDTATDDAIFKAVKAKAGVIILAPCCQKYIRKHFKVPENLESVFKHGILEEHLASFITDGLRALVLESYGYSAKVFEFVSGEHTAKNIMITAVKSEFTEENYLNKVVEIEKMKYEFGLKDFYLDKLLTNAKS